MLLCTSEPSNIANVGIAYRVMTLVVFNEPSNDMPVSVPALTNVTFTVLDILSNPNLWSLFLRPVPHDVLDTLRSEVTQEDKVRKVTIHVQCQSRIVSQRFLDATGTMA